MLSVGIRSQIPLVTRAICEIPVRNPGHYVAVSQSRASFNDEPPISSESAARRASYPPRTSERRELRLRRLDEIRKLERGAGNGSLASLGLGLCVTKGRILVELRYAGSIWSHGCASAVHISSWGRKQLGSRLLFRARIRECPARNGAAASRARLVAVFFNVGVELGQAALSSRSRRHSCCSIGGTRSKRSVCSRPRRSASSSRAASGLRSDCSETDRVRQRTGCAELSSICLRDCLANRSERSGVVELGFAILSFDAELFP